MDPGHPGQLVDPADPRILPRVAQECWSNPWPSEPGPICLGQLVDTASPRTRTQVTQDSWSTPRALGAWPESPRTAGRSHSQTDAGPRCPEQWVYTRDIRTDCESPGRDGRHCAPSNPSPRNLGQLFDTTGPPTRALVAHESCLSPRSLGHDCKLPGRGCRSHRHSDTDLSPPGELVDLQDLGHGPKSPGINGPPCGTRS